MRSGLDPAVKRWGGHNPTITRRDDDPPCCRRRFDAIDLSLTRGPETYRSQQITWRTHSGKFRQASARARGTNINDHQYVCDLTLLTVTAAMGNNRKPFATKEN